MRIIATADLHGQLPKIEPCDLLIVAGDVCPDGPSQFDWLDGEFRDWLTTVPARRVIGIAGNHDFIFERSAWAIGALHLPWVYLQDSGTEFEGLNIWGLPWVPNLPTWAFHATEPQLAEHYGWVPDDIDIIISHGPPKSYLDDVGDPFYHVGAEAANLAIERIQPEVFICGHIHEGYGHQRHSTGVEIYNVAHNDPRYRPVNPPVEIALQKVKAR